MAEPAGAETGLVATFGGEATWVGVGLAVGVLLDLLSPGLGEGSADSELPDKLFGFFSDSETVLVGLAAE